jgi:hydrogenase maturation factor HypE
VNPLIIRQILVLAKDMGATVDFEDGKILGLINVDDKYIAVAIEGFFAGIRLTAYPEGDST